MNLKQRANIDWFSKIQEDEFVTLDKKQTVPLKVLSRLADEAGLCGTDTDLIPVLSPKDQSIIFCAKVKVHFEDGSFWTGTGDCHVGNCKLPFLNYPSATAESRARARALKQALGLHHILATEEIGEGSIGQEDIDPKGRVASQVVRAIEALLDKQGITPIDLVNEIVDKKRRDTISTLSELTIEEGHKAMQFLNGRKGKK